MELTAYCILVITCAIPPEQKLLILTISIVGIGLALFVAELAGTLGHWNRTWNVNNR